MKIAKEMRQRGFEVWIAQEGDMEHGAGNGKRLYEETIARLRICDIVVAVLQQRSGDGRRLRRDTSHSALHGPSFFAVKPLCQLEML